MKKFISALLAVLSICFSCMISSNAVTESGIISLKFNSDISGYCYTDIDKLCEILSDNIKINNSGLTDKVTVADCVGNIYFEKLKPGRTYRINYSFIADNGFILPETIQKDNIEFYCGKGCTVDWVGIATGCNRDGSRYNSLAVYTTVTVDGNFFQMIFGKIADLFLRIKSWSPY